jgi:hypothetical protein
MPAPCVCPVPAPDSVPTTGEASEPNPTVYVPFLYSSHWFGPSGIGRTLEISALVAIFASFSGASAQGCGIHESAHEYRLSPCTDNALPWD